MQFPPVHDIPGLRGAKILGINPPVWDFAWFDLWAKPVGLLRVLGTLRARGNDVFLLDCMHEGRIRALAFGRRQVRREERPKPAAYARVPRRFHRFGMSEGDMKKRLSSLPKPDVILVTSVMTYWYLGVQETILAAREAFPGVPVVLGGIYATLCPGHAATLGADALFTGPFPDDDGPLPLDLYDDPTFGVLMTSHGCPMRCDYCASQILSPGYRARPLEKIFSDLEGQLCTGTIEDLAFYDDALLWEREKIFYPLCAYVRKHFPSLRLHTPNGLHVAHLDERCCHELYETGFRTIRLSLEGVDDYTVSTSSGKAGRASFGAAVNNLLAAGYRHEQIETYILVGLPGQRTTDVEASIDCVRATGCRPKLAEFSPIPGTKLFSEAVLRVPEILDEPLLHNNTIYAQHVAGTMSPETLQRLKDRTRIP